MINGEIYNYIELKKKYNLNIDNNSDCSIIFPLFKYLNYDFN